MDRFWARVEKTAHCWNWSGATSQKGYGRLYLGPPQLMVQAHRFAYERLVGPIPAGLTIDHLCRNRACVKPQHLEPVTSQTNILRGVGLAAVNARKTECIRGHPFSGSNLYVRPSNDKRYCLTCAKQLRRER